MKFDITDTCIREFWIFTEYIDIPWNISGILGGSIEYFESRNIGG